MELRKGEVQSFIDLGLKITEAKIYLTLLELGTLNASAISEVSRVARPDVYRALSDLQKLGLVEKIIANPFRFEPTPIETGITLLVERKNKEICKLKEICGCLIQRFSEKKNKTTVLPESKFVLVPCKESLINRLGEAINRTQKSIDVFTSCKRFNIACYRLAENLKKAWNRGVVGRAIIESTDVSDLVFVKSFWQSPNAEIKFVEYVPKTVMAIYDKEEVFIFVDPNSNLTESPALWSNNSSVINLAENYFETQWNE